MSKRSIATNNTKDRSAASPSVVARVAALPDLPIEELKALWRDVYQSEPPNYIRTFLEKRLAYKIQEAAFRNTNPELLERNQQRIAALIEAEDAATKKKKRDDYQMVPGTVLVREYQGVEHRVTVSPDGRFEYEGQAYASLSMIAREITGTRWSGPVFFGVKTNGQSGKSSKPGKRGGRT